MVNRILLLITLVNFMFHLHAQELNCIVNVDARQVEGSERLMFEEMQKTLFRLVNGQRWTKDEFKTNERIDCSILINLTERLSANEYRGNIQVQASRPVYNTSYKSPIMNVRDEDFVIRYNQFEPLQFNEGSYSGELTTIVAFYIYMILGYDYDSFAQEGGTSYFQEAQRIVTNAQSSSQKGWRSFESRRNRYWLIENTLNARFKPLRKAYYAYHRNGFDVLESDPTKARNSITESLEDLLPVHNVEPSSYNMQVFFNAKSQEVVKLYENATPSEIEKISELLIRIDPGNANRYEKLRK